MDHDLELIIPRLEILEIGACNVLQNPGNIGKRILFDSVLSWKYWKTDFLYFLLSWKYWKTDVLYFLISWKYMDIGFFIFPHNIEHLFLRRSGRAGSGVGCRGRRSHRGVRGRGGAPRRAGGLNRPKANATGPRAILQTGI